MEQQGHILKDFQDRDLTRLLAHEISRELSVAPRRTMRFMEVCGTHTNAFFRFGLKDLLPHNLELLSGPGCPVCVTPNETIDYAIAYSRRPEVIIATFGDMLKVPGTRSSLLNERSRGAQIKIVYSPTDAVALAAEMPKKTIIFVGIGFETTTPSIAFAMLDVVKRDLKNFLLLPAMKVMPPALAAVLDSKTLSLDGLMCPGHVSVITGMKMYEPLADKFHIPFVIAGFEPVDIMKALLSLVKQAKERTHEVINDYSRVVTWDGNQRARDIVNLMFEPCNSRWRGIGVINASGLKLRKEFKEHDVLLRIPVDIPSPADDPRCICGDVLRGLKRPTECPLFRCICTPESPVGACMVSSEGNCSIYFKYGVA